MLYSNTTLQAVHERREKNKEERTKQIATASVHMKMYLECSVEVPGVTRHNEQHHSIGATGVVIIDQSTHQVHHSIVLGECPDGREGGRREEGGGRQC